MLLMLINSIILLAGVSIALGGLVWKYFAKTPAEPIRALLASITGVIGFAVFFLQVGIMTDEPGQNLITIIFTWLNHYI